MKTYTAVQLSEILAKHKAWLVGEPGGERADLSSANLSSANLRSANLSYANLSSANLSYADLRSADLSYAGFYDTVGNMIEVKSLQCDTYQVTYTAKYMQIGCQNHEITKWFEFGDDEIKRMDSQAFKWWTVWKPILQSIIKASPAVQSFVEPTVEVNTTVEAA